MIEDAQDRASKYLKATARSLQRLKTKNLPGSVSERDVKHVLELVRGYLRDGRHYVENGKPVTSLACIAYAEGLLDALKLLGLVEI